MKFDKQNHKFLSAYTYNITLDDLHTDRWRYVNSNVNARLNEYIIFLGPGPNLPDETSLDLTSLDITSLQCWKTEQNFTRLKYNEFWTW
jgi:hypothetical protein